MLRLLIFSTVSTVINFGVTQSVPRPSSQTSGSWICWFSGAQGHRRFAGKNHGISGDFPPNLEATNPKRPYNWVDLSAHHSTFRWNLYWPFDFVQGWWTSFTGRVFTRTKGILYFAAWSDKTCAYGLKWFNQQNNYNYISRSWTMGCKMGFGYWTVFPAWD